MKINVSKHSLTAVFVIMMFFIQVLEGCSWKGHFENEKAQDQKPRIWNSIPGFKTFSCFAPYSCGEKQQCPKMKLLNHMMKNHYRWNLILPTKSIIDFKDTVISLSFIWEKQELLQKHNKSQLEFTQEQAFLISLIPTIKDFFNRDIDISKIKTNIPCYFTVNTSNKHINSCPHITQEILVDQDFKNKNTLLKKYTPEKQYSKIVGSICPQKFVTNKWYTIEIPFNKNYVHSSGLEITSELIENTSFIRNILSSPKNEVRNCPELIYPEILDYKNNRYICGRYSQKTWINRLCVPTRTYRFVPGLDTENHSIRKAFCYDSPHQNYVFGDDDGWFDTRSHLKSNDEVRPISNNMVLHGTHIGDCKNSNPNDLLVTDHCQWYNIGQIKSGIQCYYKNADTKKLCFYDQDYKITFNPESFISTYINHSSLFNNYKSSLDYIGRASSWVKHVKNGFIQYFSYGDIGTTLFTQRIDDKNTYHIKWPFWDIYRLRFNHVYGKLGYPISFAKKEKDYFEQRFEHGYIRKYYKTEDGLSCFSVKIKDHMPEKYCETCNINADCAQKNTLCLQGYCIEKSQITKNLEKKCLDNGHCMNNMSCLKNICK